MIIELLWEDGSIGAIKAFSRHPTLWEKTIRGGHGVNIFANERSAMLAITA